MRHKSKCLWLQSTKILRDGVIIIIKGDKMYNILGQTLK